MSKLIHTGARPKYLPLTEVKHGLRFRHREDLPDGSKKFWSTKELGSGCFNEVDPSKTLRGLIYCEFCDEFYNTIEFKEEI